MRVKIRNLRNLNMSENIEINRLNIVVGKNSSGKSSFLRFFPLMKQSVETKSVSPVLWYGNYVDFGSFEEARCAYRQEPIEISFSTNVKESLLGNTIVVNALNNKFYLQRFLRQSFNRDRYNEFIDFSYSIGLIKDEIKKVKFSFDGNLIELNGVNDSVNIKINERQVKYTENIIIKNNSGNTIIPINLFLKEKEKQKINSLSNISYNTSHFYFDNMYGEGFVSGFVYIEMKKILQNLARKGTKKENVEDAVYKILKFGFFNFLISMKSGEININIPKQIEKRLFDCQYSEKKDRIIDLLLINEFNNYILIANHSFLELTNRIDYIAPLRATAERYYRKQSLLTSKIDSRGENVHAFIDSLNDKEREKLNSWLLQHFGFKIDKSLSTSHNSIYITDKMTNIQSNMADCGFGYSQLLPIILQVWLILQEEHKKEKDDVIDNKLDRLIIIEQPELHLHPALQANLIDAICNLVNIAKKHDEYINFIIETHSETIVNRVYNMTELKKFDPEDLQILIFDKDNLGDAIIEKSYISDNSIINWPFGFFAPEVN